jgi:hypothetical protein
MFRYTFVQALGHARLADLHHQAQRDALARAARRARRHQATHRAPDLLAALTRWARTWAPRRRPTAATPVATAPPPDQLPPPGPSARGLTATGSGTTELEAQS